ncbi:MAG: TlyA family RNA methyltransferase [Deltaproteobacteria bacterium]|nr:TlyA family RNA methyltransferase [Deltaproteobacteria bacterium]
MAKSGRIRADVALVEQGMAPSCEKARALILAGEVLAGDTPVNKAGDWLAADAVLRLRNQPLLYVSRGGIKLAHALDVFGVTIANRIAVDIGASTGGFTDCLLQRGIARVFCVDVGHGQLASKIAKDERVAVIDRTNIRNLEPGRIGVLCDLAVADVSFISLRRVFPSVLPLLRTGADFVVLVKPQFEVARTQVGKGGIVRDEAARIGAVDSVAAAAATLGLIERGRTQSPITGGKGNVEYLLHLVVPVSA